MSIEKDIINLLRSVMYSGENENMLAEVEDLGKLLDKYNNVSCDADKNKLVCILAEVKSSYPDLWKSVEHLND
jgi:hypothetical protein